MKFTQRTFDIIMAILFAVSALVALMWIAVMRLDNKEARCRYENANMHHSEQKMVCKPKKD